MCFHENSIHLSHLIWTETGCFEVGEHECQVVESYEDSKGNAWLVSRTLHRETRHVL